MEHLVTLYESPVLRVRTPEGVVELSLERLDTVKGYRQDRVHVGSVLERAAAMEAGELDAAAVVEAVRLWFLHAFGQERYDRIFATPERRASFGWHERVFLAAREALARGRAQYIERMADAPLLRELDREEAVRRLRDNAAAAAVAQGRERDERAAELD